MLAAAALADEARTMDLADRFLNSECVKRMLQADKVCILMMQPTNCCVMCISVVTFFYDSFFLDCLKFIVQHVYFSM